MKILYSVFIALFTVLFFTNCDQLRVFDRGGSSGGNSGGGSGGGKNPYGTTGDYDEEGRRRGETDFSGDGGSNNDDGEYYCPVEDGDCEEEDERYSKDYDDLEDEYDGVSGNINFEGANTMQEYRTGIRANHPIERGRVYVDMNREGNHRYYSGRIEVAFKVRRASGEDEVISQEFSSGYGNDNRYNVWANFNGKLGFHAFFSDAWKGVILVIDEVINVKNERTARDQINLKNQLGSGSIWFKSFLSHHRNNQNDCYEGGNPIPIGAPGSPPAPSKKCWFIGVGPYDCRAWPSGNIGVNTFQALEPRNSCYKKLGDFDGLNISKAFDTDDDGNIYIAQ